MVMVVVSGGEWRRKTEEKEKKKLKGERGVSMNVKFHNSQHMRTVYDVCVL